MKGKKGRLGGMQKFTLYMAPEVVDVIKAVAAAENRTANNWVEHKLMKILEWIGNGNSELREPSDSPKG